MKPLHTQNQLGRLGETIACRELTRHGLTIIAQNWRAGRLGEVDVIACDAAQNLLVFAEVKTRRSQAFGAPIEAVTPRKQETMRRVAECFLLQNPAYQAFAIRFDVLGILFTGAGQPAEIVYLVDSF